jgi:hypothetical protein
VVGRLVCGEPVPAGLDVDVVAVGARRRVASAILWAFRVVAITA